jgi:UMP-CMP kinase
MGSAGGGGWPMIRICPFSAGLFIVSALLIVRALLVDNDQRQKRDNENDDKKKLDESVVSFRVVFVLGAPGVGKGTQCQLLCQQQNNKDDNDRSSSTHWCHLSAGDLLRAERQKGTSILATEINRCIDAGQLVRSEITCQLLYNAMRAAYETNRSCTNFLVDGYPRSQGNVDAWDRMFGTTTSSSSSSSKGGKGDNDTNNNIRTDVVFVLNYVCPEDVLVGRLLERGKSSGRNDDNLATIQKRFQTFQAETNPIIDWYKNETNIPVYDIRTDKPIQQVHTDTLQYFTTTTTLSSVEETTTPTTA